MLYMEHGELQVKTNAMQQSPRDMTNLISVTFKGRHGGLQSTKGYHHPLTLLGTTTAILNESQVCIRYTKGWKVSTVYNSDMVILGNARMGEKRTGTFLCQYSSPHFSLSLSATSSLYTILLEYNKKHQKTTRRLQREGNVKFHSYLQGPRIPHQNPHHRCLVHHETTKALRSSYVSSP